MPSTSHTNSHTHTQNFVSVCVQCQEEFPLEFDLPLLLLLLLLTALRFIHLMPSMSQRVCHYIGCYGGSKSNMMWINKATQSRLTLQWCAKLCTVCVCLYDVRGFAFQMKNASIQNRLYVATDARVLGWSRLLACAHAHSHTQRFVRFCSLYGKNSFQKESDEERQPTQIRKKRLGEKTLQKVCHRFLFALRHVFVLGSLFACLFRSFVRLGFDVDDKTHWWICFVGFVAHKLIVCPPNTLQHSVSSDNYHRHHQRVATTMSRAL